MSFYTNFLLPNRGSCAYVCTCFACLHGMCVCTGCSRAPPPKAHERSSCSALIRGRPTLFSARHFSCLRCTSVLLAEPLLLVHHVVCVIFMAMPMCTLRPRRLATFVPGAPGCSPGAQKGPLGPPQGAPNGAPGYPLGTLGPWVPGARGAARRRSRKARDDLRTKRLWPGVPCTVVGWRCSAKPV